jgi:hypothetical protein
LPAILGVATVFNVEDINEGKPVRVPEEVLEGLEAVRRYAGTDVLDIARVRYLAQERGRSALAVWVDKHPHEEYARGVLYGFRTHYSSGGSALGGLRVPLVVVS